MSDELLEVATFFTTGSVAVALLEGEEVTTLFGRDEEVGMAVELRVPEVTGITVPSVV